MNRRTGAIAIDISDPAIDEQVAWISASRGADELWYPWVMPFAKSNGQELYFEDTGGDGPALVFMHGFLMDHRMFDAQVESLSARYRCVRWDARAFGKTRWDGQPFSLYDSVADCIGLMDHLGIAEATLIGMSQGGFCALRAALRHPDRVRALVLLSTQSGVADDNTKVVYRQMRDTWAASGPIEPLIDGLANALLGPREQFADAWDTWVPRWKQHSVQQLEHALNNLVDRDDIDPQIAEIACPALIAHGTDDGMPIAVGEKLANDLPNCRGFIAIPGAYHAACMTHPDALAAPLDDFLTKYAK
ncbi:MAG: alpha/beta hydrolase [Myxococcota bacterium]